MSGEVTSVRSISSPVQQQLGPWSVSYITLMLSSWHLKDEKWKKNEEVLGTKFESDCSEFPALGLRNCMNVLLWPLIPSVMQDSDFHLQRVTLDSVILWRLFESNPKYDCSICWLVTRPVCPEHVEQGCCCCCVSYFLCSQNKQSMCSLTSSQHLRHVMSWSHDFCFRHEYWTQTRGNGHCSSSD